MQATGNWCSHCGSVSVTPTQSIAGNHLLVVFALGCGVLGGGGCTTATISDTANNAWSGPTTEDGPLSYGEAYMWYTCASKSATDTVKITESASPAQDLHIHVYEVDGIQTANCLDTYGTAGLLFSQTPGRVYTAGSVIQPSEYVVAFFADWNTNVTWTQGSGYTTQVQTNNPTTGDSAASEELNTKTGLSGGQNATMTLSTNDVWKGIIAAFKAVSPIGIGASSRSDILSDSRPSVTSNHTFAFTANESVYGSLTPGSSSTLALSYPSGFTVPPSLDCGDVDAATSSQFNFNWPACQATATAWGLTVQTGHALVQTRHAGADSTASRTATFQSNTAAGNTIIVAAVHFGGAVSSISDSQGNTYASAVVSASSTGNAKGHIWYAANIHGGANTITVNYGSSVTNDLLIYEYSGLALSNVLDQTSSATGTGTAVNSGTATTTQPNELVFGFSACDSCGEQTPGSLLTARDYFNADVVQDRVANATGAYSVTSTLNPSGGWLSMMATFRLNSLPLGSLTLVPPTDSAVHVATTTPITVNIGSNATVQRQGTHWITNPSSGGTYQISLGGSSGNAGNFDVAIGEQVPVPIQFVQTNVVDDAGASNQDSTGFSSNNMAGDLIVVAILWDKQSASVSSVTDTTGNTYTRALGPINGISTQRAQLFYAKNIAGGNNTLTVKLTSAATAHFYVYAHEYSGVDTVSPLDGTSSATSSSGTAMDSGSATTKQANELIFGAGFISNAVQSAGTGFTARSTYAGNMTEDRNVAAVGSYNATETGDGTSWMMMMATFKAAMVPAGGLTAKATVQESLSLTVSSVPAGIKVVQAVQSLSGAYVWAPAMTNNVGNSLKVACRQGHNENSITGVSDTAGNTYTLVNSGFRAGSAEVQVYEALNIKGSSSNVVSCNFSGTGMGIMGIVVTEVSGLATSSDQDGSVTSVLNNSGTTATSGPLTTTNANDILIYSNDIGGDAAQSCGTGYAAPANGSNNRLIMCYQIVSSAGTYSTTSTWGSAQKAEGVFAAFTKGAGNITVVQAVQSLQGKSIDAPLMVNTAGNSLKVACRQGHDSTSISGVTDSAGNTYTLVNTGFRSGSGESQVYEALNILASTNNVVTCTFASIISETTGIVVMEVSGLVTASDVDTSVTSVHAVADNTATSGPLTTTSANEILIYAVDISGNDTLACGTGYSVPSGGSNARQILCYKIVSATGTYSTTSTWVTSQTADGVFAAFKGYASTCTADDGASITQISTTATAVPFGTISPNTFYGGCQDLAVATNSVGGYSLAAQEDHALRSSSGVIIPDTACDSGQCSSVSSGAWVTAANNGFGHTCADQLGHDCAGEYVSGAKFRPFANIAAGTAGINFVQTKYDNVGGVNTETFSLSATSISGDLIIISITHDNTAASVRSVTDTKGNVYTLAVGPVLWPTSPFSTEVWYAKNISAGTAALSITINLTGTATTFINSYVEEYSGIDPVNALDQTSSYKNGLAGTTFDSATKTTTFANELIFGHGEGQGPAITAANGFTARNTIIGNVDEDRIVSAAGPNAAAFNADSNGEAIGIMATFRANTNVGQVLMSSSTPAIATGRVKYRLSTGAQQAAGTYTNTISYTVIGTY